MLESDAEKHQEENYGSDSADDEDNEIINLKIVKHKNQKRKSESLSKKIIMATSSIDLRYDINKKKELRPLFIKKNMKKHI